MRRYEFTNTLLRPKFDKYISTLQRLSAIAAFKTNAYQIDTSIAISDCRDPKDNKSLELAVESQASCIITGDKDLLILHPFQGIPIMNAADFLQSF